MGQTSEGDLARFYDASGKEVPLVRGRIFIQVVPTGTSVTGRARSEALICQGVIQRRAAVGYGSRRRNDPNALSGP